MNRETLLAELDRLLELGEPLFDVFPRVPDSWRLQLPDNISDEMHLYANNVAWKAKGRKGYQDFCQRVTTDRLAAWVKRGEVGLLGWRAIGVLK